MAERVQTGGAKSFEYKGNAPKLDDKEKQEIEQAYQKADERKAKEKRNKIIMIIVAILILLIIIGAFVIF